MRHRFAGALAATLALVACFITPALAMALENPIEAGVSALLATGVVATDRSIKEIKADLGKLLTELAAGQKEMEAGPLTQARGEELDAKAVEAEALQAQVDQYERMRGIAARGREVPDPMLPAGAKEREAQPDGGPAGYMTLGEYVTSHPAFIEAAKAGFPKGTAARVAVAAMIGQSKTLYRGPHGEPLVPLSAEERKERQEVLGRETKAAPVIGTGIIEPQRVDRLAQVTRDDVFTLRDVLDVSQTNSDAVKYFREESFTNAAAPTAQGGTKPESALEYSSQTADIEVIAHHMPVHNQQLADWPALRGLIDGRLRYGLRRVEENQVLYGDGVTPNIEGLLTVAGTHDIAVADARITTPTLIDQVRVGITEVRRANYEPNAVVLDPIDWEAIELEKGSDNRYVWAVIRDTLGPRIWGLRVVETSAAEARAGNTTEARNLLVGDFRNGATLYDRMAATVMVGWINAQFIQNQQTLLAEERVGLAIYAPAAFAKLQTQAAVV